MIEEKARTYLEGLKDGMLEVAKKDLEASVILLVFLE